MYLTPVGLLRPDLISSYRKTFGEPGPDGNATATVAQLYNGLPAFVDHATRGVSDKLEWVEQTGEMVAQTDTCYLDGLMPAQFIGLSPGDSFSFNGVTYIVDYDGRGAFPDIQPFDVVTRGSDAYLCLQATRYTDVFPVMILHLNFGRAWPIPTPPPPEIDVIIKGTGSFNCSAPSYLQVENGGDATVETNDTFSIDITGGAGILVNGGSLAIGGDYADVDLSNAGTLLDIEAGGSVILGESAGDSTDFSMGVSAVGIITVYGLLKLIGDGALEVGGSTNGALTIFGSGSLLMAGDAYAQIAGALGINAPIVVPTDNAITTPAGGVLGMFTHEQSGLTASFTDASFADGSQGSIVSWAWNFGDSTTSTEQNPSHTYGSPGAYSVTLVVTTSGGAQSTVQANVTVS